MKTILKRKSVVNKIRSQSGFTLVELLVVVAIIGLLSAIALPNFRTYQSKSKMAEAKLQLANLFVAESTFHSEFGIYATCLGFMAYDPSPEKTQRYYAMGFGASVLNNIADPAWNSAVNTGLKTTAGEGSNYCVLNDGPVDGRSFFSAGKGTGSAIASTATYLDGPSANGTMLGAHTTGDIDPAVNTGINFRAGASGIINGTYSTTSTSSFLTIDNRKKISIIRNGF